MSDERCSCGADAAWHCQLCHDQLDPPLGVIRHLENIHGVTLDSWPDGQPVIVDTTLEPEDFT